MPLFLFCARPMVDRITRRVVVGSALLAVVAYLVTIRVDSPLDAGVGLALALAAGLGARFASRWTTRIVVASGFVAPAVLYLALGGRESYHRTMWLVPVATWLAVAAPTEGWSLPARWRPLLAGWALAIALSWPIVFFRELDFAPSLLSASMSNGVVNNRIWAWALSVADTALLHIVGVLWLDWLAARYRREQGRGALVRDVLLPAGGGLLVACTVGAYQAWVDLDWLTTPGWLQVRRATGPFFDGNALGMVAATWSVVLAGLIWSWGRGTARTAGAAAALLIGAAGVFASGSRTAFVVQSVGTLFLLVGAARAQRVRPARLMAGAAVVTSVVLVAVWASAGRQTDSPVQRLAATLEPMTAGGVRTLARSLWERNGWGTASVTAIAEHPVTGIGLGTFNLQSADYHFRRTGRPIPPDNAQNWWRHEMAEWGLTGGIITFGWTALFGWFLLKGRARPEDRAAAGAVRGVLLGLAFVSLFSVPMQPIVAVSVWTFIFLAWYLLQEPSVARPWGAWSWVAVIAFAAFATGAQAYAATHDLRPPVRMQRVGKGYGYGFWRGSVDRGRAPYWLTGRQAVFVFPLQPGEFRFTVTPLHPDLDKEPVRVEVWLGRKRVVDTVARNRTPIGLAIPLAEGQRAIFLETRVSRTFRGPRGRETGLRIDKRFTPSAR